MDTIKTLAIAWACCLTTGLTATEASTMPQFYPEFVAAMYIIDTLHKEVNKTAIDVKSPTTIRNGNLIMTCDPHWNTTDQGLVIYFEEEHPTSLRTPFGELMLFWHTRKNSHWKPVTKKFKQTCVLDQEPFKGERGFVYNNAFKVLSYNNRPLPMATLLLQGDQKRAARFAACIAQYSHDGGTLTELKSVKNRKIDPAPTLDNPLTLLCNMLDLSN